MKKAKQGPHKGDVKEARRLAENAATCWAKDESECCIEHPPEYRRSWLGVARWSAFLARPHGPAIPGVRSRAKVLAAKTMMVQIRPLRSNARLPVQISVRVVLGRF